MLVPNAEGPTFKVALYRTSSIGDAILATACLDLLHRWDASVEITWIGREPSLELIQSAWPSVRTVAVSRTDSLRDLEKLMDCITGYHLLVDLQGNLRSRYFSHRSHRKFSIPTYSSAKEQIFRNRLLIDSHIRGRRKPLPKKSLRTPFRQYELMLNTLKCALRKTFPQERTDGLGDIGARPRLPTPTTLKPTPWLKELRFGQWLAVAPGAAHPTKQAPAEAFHDCLRLFQGIYKSQDVKDVGPIGLCLIGDDADRYVANQLLEKLHWQWPVLNLAGKLTLWETAQALKQSTVLLTNDSALSHLAEAVDTPVGTLFGPTIESFGFAPYRRDSQPFSSLIGCRPCSKHGKVPCRYGDRLCFVAIPKEDVARYLVSRFRPGTGYEDCTSTAGLEAGFPAPL